MKNNIQWQRVYLKDVCESIIDCINKTAPKVDYETPYKMIRTTNVKKGWVNLSEVKYVTEEVYKKWTRRAIPNEGDIILTREAPLGEVGMLRVNDTVFLGQRLVQYRADPAKLNNHFLLYSFQANDLQGQIKSFGSGSTVEHMRVPDCEKLTILLPPLSVQNKVASILSAYDDLIENNTRRIKILESMAQTLYQEWFVKFRFPGHEQVKMVESELGLIPEGWEVISIKELIDKGILEKNQDGNHGEKHPKSNDYQSSGIPFLMARDIVDNLADLSNCNYISLEQSKSLRVGFAKQGDVLLTHKATMGRVAILEKIDNFVVLSPQVTYYRIKNKSLISKSFLYCTFIAERFQNILLFQSEQSTRKYMSITNQRKIKIVYPSIEVIRQFNCIVDDLLSQKNILYNKNINLRKTRDLLLPKLISGQIDVENLDIDTGEIAA